MIFLQSQMLKLMKQLAKSTRHCETVWHDSASGYYAKLERERCTVRLERDSDGFFFAITKNRSRFTFSGSGMRHYQFRTAALKIFFAILWQRLLLESFYLADIQIPEICPVSDSCVES